MDILILFSMGAIAGTLAGLLGIGGGIIIVPVLALVFSAQGVNVDVLMHVSIGTSLATIVITSISSIRAHQQHQAIQWAVFRRITPGVLFGALLGALLAKFISGDNLQVIFGVFMLFVAAQMIFGNTTEPHRQLPKTLGMFMAGTSIGTISSLMGVGGGSMSVPFLTWCNIAIRNAVATSSAIGLPIAIAGVSGFILTGWGVEHRPLWSLGFVNIPAFFSIVVASTLFAPVGARLTHRIPPRRLRLFFGFFLLILSVKFLYV
ncbi:sulfite exporter TauE/SafE family protein [Sulfuriflexus mobilis]|uniref:sulfite exporter TauE/SafE family protein n=1 Tax=Sulfuriflexus mobilis TaxID=1811807 RepID=UPI001E31BF17|nr:sulfite exporter TauE/SafE family protein [Sulfuriflexus mobilis]